jgi:hypothetical protein
LRPDPGHRGQFVDAFLPDDGRIHIRDQQALAAVRRRQGRDIAARRGQRGPRRRAMPRLGVIELGRAARGQPARRTVPPSARRS